MTRLVALLALLAFALSCYAAWFYMALFWGAMMLWAEVRVQFARVERVSVARERMSA